ncbi:MAG TPA: DUF1707 domain-containing protein [Nocardioidaceae bacterium]|nr:DUF1707 domain-containing protein [Nocardioidaceae bacterium]
MSPQQAQQAETRIGDAEREHAVSALGEHYLAGRLTKEEYDDRAAAAWTAKTMSQLQPLFWDLPVQQPAPQPPTKVKQRARRRRRGIPLPLIVLALVLLAVLGVPWWGWLILGWMVLASCGRSACR